MWHDNLSPIERDIFAGVALLAAGVCLCFAISTC